MKALIICNFIILFGHNCYAQSNSIGAYHVKSFGQSISLTSADLRTNPQFSASAVAYGGTPQESFFNNGNALTYFVSSSSTCTISISAQNSVYIPSSSSLPIADRDIRNYIFYTLVDNQTGGKSLNANIETPLGTGEKTIIADCPPNWLGKEVLNMPKSFSLILKLRAGYSLPPGTYITHLLITATYE